MMVATLPEHLAKHYTDNLGFALVPIPNGKRPTATGWQDNPITDAAKIPSGYNIGLLHHYSKTATLDLDHPAAAVALKAAKIDLEAILQAAPYKIIGNPEKPPKPLFLVPDDFDLKQVRLLWPDPSGELDAAGRLKTVCIFELRGGHGFQDVLPPSIHPDTGRAYAWADGRAPESRADIPMLPIKLLGLWQSWDLWQPAMVAACPWAEPEQPKPSKARRPATGPARDSGDFDPGIVAARFNEEYTPGDILGRNGYKLKGKKWLAPSSSTKAAGIIELGDGNKIKSYHGSDPLGDGKPHDAWDCFVILEHGGDYKAAWHQAAQTYGIAAPSRQHLNGNGRASQPGDGGDDGQGPPSDQADGRRPRIQTNARHHRDVSADAYQAMLKANNPPAVFLRAGQLTRIVTDENDRPTAGRLDADSLTHILDRAADFYSLRYNKGQQDWTETPGPLQQAVVKDILAYPTWPELPALAGIVTAPTFAPNGELITTAGYSPATRLYYHKNGLSIGDTRPTAENVAIAKNLILHNLLIDFPFADEASAAHAVALLLLPFVRPMIDGNTPLHMTDAPEIGTGKGLLNTVLTLPFAPEGIAAMTAPSDPEEWRKKLISVLLGAPSHIMIDNIKGRVESPDLEAALTTDAITDRLLGTMQNVTVSTRCVWLATANNAALSPDLTRRTIWIRLDAGMERPWQRHDFAHSNLIEWAKQNRGDIVTAALTLVNKWIADGMKPGPFGTMGSFERWEATMGGILAAVGIPGFLGNTDKMLARLDENRAPWSSFVAAWYEKFQTNEVGTAELFPLASDYDSPGELPVKCLDLLGEELDGRTERARKTQLGIILRKNESRVFEGYKIIKSGDKKHAARYKLVRTNDQLVS